MNPFIIISTLILLMAAPPAAWAKKHKYTPTPTPMIETNDQDDGAETATPTETGEITTPSETPTPTSTKTPTVTRTVTSTQTPTITPTESATNTPTTTPTQTVTNTSTVTPTVTPTDSFNFDLSAKIQQADVSVIPNPAWGTKLSFRVMLPGPSLVRIRIYNQNLEFFDKIEKDGNRVFDILWSLKNVPQGLYYYQVQIVDQASGNITKLPLTNFAVMK